MLINYIITILLLILICYFIYIIFNKQSSEHFSDELPTLTGPVFVHLYDDKGTKINVALISKPIGYDSDYKQYVQNKHHFIYLGISSYMEFPHMPTNPEDNYELEKFNNVTTPYELEMYFNLCEGWLHCFRDPNMYLPSDKLNVLISESDFVNYKVLTPDDTVKEYDFLYSCPKVTETSSCNDWVSHNKNWQLALKCLPILCEKFKLKGLLVGRKGCEIPEGCKPYIETTGFLDYNEMLKMYKKCKFIFVPNQRDASPRVVTEALSFNLPCLLNRNILGGWKYINDKTGEFFGDETDIEVALTTLLKNMQKYTPRQYIIDNYGPVNSGKRLKEFLFKNFKDRLNITDCKYVVMRGMLHGYDDVNNS